MTTEQNSGSVATVICQLNKCAIPSKQQAWATTMCET